MLGSVAISSCAFIAFFSVLCVAEYENHLTYNQGLGANIREEKPLQCYDCNSLFDPRCADPFNSYTIGVVNCSDRPTPEHIKYYFNTSNEVKPTLCRKIIQKVQEQIRIIRSCGYIQGDHDNKPCLRRHGTAGVEMIYCACSGSLCNVSQSLYRPYSSIATFIVAITIAIINFLGGQLR